MSRLLALLRGHPLASITGAVCLAIALACAAAPLLDPCPPTEMRPWIGAQAPGYRHPDVLADNRFVPGQAAGMVARASGARELRLTIDASASEDLRIVAREGRLDLRDARTLAMASLDLAASPARELLPDGRLGRELPRVELRAGDPPPPGLFAPGQPTALVARRVLAERTETLRVRLDRGQVAAVERDGAAVPGGLRVRGEQVLAVQADGRDLELVHPLGTDPAGRDVLARVLHGGRISLLVALVATLVSLAIGTAYGAVSGWRGGRTDTAMMGAVDILYAIPFLFLVILLVVHFGNNLYLLFAALGAVQWLTTARIVRAQVLTLTGRDFVLAARAAGLPGWRIVARHLVPNCIGPVLVYATLTIPAVILEESFLSFIGLQVQVDGRALDSWGALVGQGVAALGTHGERSWLLLAPALAMTLFLVAVNLLGDALRDSLDPRLRR